MTRIETPYATLTRVVTGLSMALLVAACGPQPSNEVCDLLAGMSSSEARDEGATSTNGISANGISANGISANGISANRLTFNELSANKLTANRLTFNRLTFNALALNKLAANRLTFNGTTYQGLNFNKLAANRLTFNGLDANASEEVEELATTQEGRELLEYVARCALTDEQAITVDVDGELLTFPGSLGVAPAWLERGLDDGEQRWVSACLLAHVNAFGLSVPISVRADDVIGADEVERQAFPIHEGAFFGSVAEQAFYSCWGDDPTWARSVSADRSRRVCTDVDSECEIPSLGACESVCERYEPGIGWSRCSAEGRVYDEVVNTHLREDATLAACGLE